MNAKVRSEVLRSLIGLVTWSISLINYIVDELFSLGNALKDHGKSPGANVTWLEAKGQKSMKVHHLSQIRKLIPHSA